MLGNLRQTGSVPIPADAPPSALQHGFQLIVDPSGKNRGFYRHSPPAAAVFSRVCIARHCDTEGEALATSGNVIANPPKAGRIEPRPSCLPRTASRKLFFFLIPRNYMGYHMFSGAVPPRKTLPHLGPSLPASRFWSRSAALFEVCAFRPKMQRALWGLAGPSFLFFKD